MHIQVLQLATRVAMLQQHSEPKPKAMYPTLLKDLRLTHVLCHTHLPHSPYNPTLPLINKPEGPAVLWDVSEWEGASKEWPGSLLDAKVRLQGGDGGGRGGGTADVQKMIEEAEAQGEVRGPGWRSWF